MKNQASNNSVYDTTIRLFILLLIIGWCLMIMYPFVSIILWSLILALAIYPLHSALAKKIGGRPKLASVIIILSILVNESNRFSAYDEELEFFSGSWEQNLTMLQESDSEQEQQWWQLAGSFYGLHTDFQSLLGHLQ